MPKNVIVKILVTEQNMQSTSVNHSFLFLMLPVEDEQVQRSSENFWYSEKLHKGDDPGSLVSL